MAATSPGSGLEFHARVAGSVAGDDQRMLDRLFLVLAQKPPHPADAVALDDVVGIQAFVQVGDIGNVAADDDFCVRLVAAHQFAHLPHFQLVGDDRRDPDNVVGVPAQLLDETVERRKVEHGAGGLDVRLDQHQSPAAVEHPQGERTLRARDLVVIQLHRVHHPRAELVVLRVGAEHAAEQHAGAGAGGVPRGRGRTDGGHFEASGTHRSNPSVEVTPLFILRDVAQRGLRTWFALCNT